MNANNSSKKNISKILVIENKESSLKNLFRSLSNHGYPVDTVQDKDEIDILKEAKMVKPDIIFLDVSTPNNLDKIEICKKIKKDPETRDIQLIIFNEYRSKKTTAKCLEVGADDFLSNNPEYFEILTKIRKSLQVKEYGNIKKEHEILTLLFKEVQKAKTEWEQSMDCINDIIVLTDLEDNIVRCNKMLLSLTGKTYKEFLGEKWDDISKENGFVQETDDPYHTEILHRSGKRFHLNFSQVKDIKDDVCGKIIHLHDITGLRHLEKDIEIKNEQLQKAYNKLKEAQSQILQQEKMASIGQLASGIAHEINNPIGFIMSNLNSLHKYIDRILEFVNVQSKAFDDICGPAKSDINTVVNGVRKKQHSLKLDYILGDIGNLIKESLDGTYRVKKIVQDLKSFAHVDEAGYKWADINSGLDSTINIVWNELKYKVTLKKEYGDIPMTKCNPGQLNQVFMNMLVNAAQAIEKHGEIVVKTWQENNYVCISISDTGHGMPKEVQNRLFDPFFTTKDVGKGTGLGLSIAFDIVKKHNGEINVDSKVDEGTTFTTKIPVVNKK